MATISEQDARREEATKNRIVNRLLKISSEDRSAVTELFDILNSQDCEQPDEVCAAIVEILYPETLAAEPVDPGPDVETVRRVAEYRKKVGATIRKARQGKGMTQEQLADAAGLPQTHVSRLETGKHVPTYLTIERLANALGTTPSQLDPGFDD